MEDADDVVDRAAVDGQARELLLAQQGPHGRRSWPSRAGPRSSCAGTMMSRTVLSPNSTTLWRRRVSSRWMTPSSAPRLKTLLSSSSVRPGAGERECRRGAAAGWSAGRRPRRPGTSTFIIQASGHGDRARDGDGRRRADRLGRHLGEDEEGDRREERRRAITPYRAPNHPVASVVAEAEAAERKRFWPIRMTASSRDVWAFRFRMIAPRRSPRSRIAAGRCGRGRPAPSPSRRRSAEKTSERTKASTYRTVCGDPWSLPFDSADARVYRGRPLEPVEGPAGRVREARLRRAAALAAPAGTPRPRWPPAERAAFRWRPRRAARLTAVVPKRRLQAPLPIARISARAGAAAARGPRAGVERRVPGADLLADVAAEDVVAERRLPRVRDRRRSARSSSRRCSVPASSMPGATKASVGQASRQRDAGAALLGDRRVGGQVEVGDDLGEQEVRALRRVDQAAVLADPAEPRRRGEGALGDRRRVHADAAAQRARQPARARGPRRRAPARAGSRGNPARRGVAGQPRAVRARRRGRRSGARRGRRPSGRPTSSSAGRAAQLRASSSR